MHSVVFSSVLRTFLLSSFSEWQLQLVRAKDERLEWRGRVGHRSVVWRSVLTRSRMHATNWRDGGDCYLLTRSSQKQRGELAPRDGEDCDRWWDGEKWVVEEGREEGRQASDELLMRTVCCIETRGGWGRRMGWREREEEGDAVMDYLQEAPIWLKSIHSLNWDDDETEICQSSDEQRKPIMIFSSRRLFIQRRILKSSRT